MTKMFKNLIFFFLFTYLVIIFISNSSLVINSVNYSLKIFINTLLPSLFPFFILSDILNNYNYLYYLSKIFKFKYSNIIIMSLFSGLPSNAKYVSMLLQDNAIRIKDANVILSFTFFPNPMFVITSIGFLMYDDTIIGLKMLFIVYLSNLLIYLFNYRKLDNIKINNKIKPKPFFSLLKFSILNSIETLFVILGTIIVFNILNNIFNEYLIQNELISSIINCILEMTSGITKIFTLNISDNLKCIITTVTLTFSSLSILFQAFSILEDYHINKSIIIKNKIILVLVSLILSLLIF